MSLNIKNKEVERLVGEVAQLTGESKTEAVRRSLEERRARLACEGAGSDRGERLRRFLETEVWPHVPQELGRKLSRKVGTAPEATGSVCAEPATPRDANPGTAKAHCAIGARRPKTGTPVRVEGVAGPGTGH